MGKGIGPLRDLPFGRRSYSFSVGIDTIRTRSALDRNLLPG